MVRFREVQRFPLWADLLLLGSGLVAPAIVAFGEPSQFTPWVLAIPCFFLLLWLLVFRMVTTVESDRLVVSFGWISSYRKEVLLSDISEAHVVQYNPIRDFGGWGIRGIPVSCLNARGNVGVQLQLNDGRFLLVGSQIADELLKAIRR